MSDHPRSVLFACNRNTIRSPMAEALMKHLLGYRINVDSVGVRLSASEVDPFAIAALAEIGLDISQHRPKTFDHLHDRTVDLIVTFTPQAQHRAVELTREVDCDIEYWPLSDPTLIEGNRETRLAAYRDLREALFERIIERFPLDLRGQLPADTASATLVCLDPPPHPSPSHGRQWGGCGPNRRAKARRKSDRRFFFFGWLTPRHWRDGPASAPQARGRVREGGGS